MISTKIYDKQDAFNFEKVNFPFIDGDVPHSPSYGVYISQLIRFARVCCHVDDRYHQLHKAFSKFYYKHSELIGKYNICFKTFL